MNPKTRMALIMNVLVALSVATGLYLAYGNGVLDFRQFEYLSGCVALVSSLLYVVCIVSAKEQKGIPVFVAYLRYVAAISLLMSLALSLTAIPAFSADGYVSEVMSHFSALNNILLEVVASVLSVYSFVMFEGDRRLNRKKTVMYGTLPAAVYGVVLAVLSYLGQYSDIYGFMNSGVIVNVGIWVVFVVVCYVLARMVMINNQKRAPRISRRKD